MGSGEGRIPSQAFTGSLSTFLAICLIISAVRCYIRFGVLRERNWEDVLFISGVVFLIAGIALIFKITDTLFEGERLLFGDGIMALEPSGLPALLDRQASARTIIIVGLSLMWLTLSCVKFCFLAFFKKLIRQMPKMIKFWWVVVVYNVAASIYGFLTFYLPCPLFKKSELLQSLQCHQEGPRLNLLVAMSWAQMATDIFGDVLILAIPLTLIWKIRVGWSQKLALTFSLCLTIVVVILTIIRIAGLRFQGKVDAVWETWCIAISAEIGLSLVAVSAFRALYVAKAKDRRVNRTITSFGWYNKGLSIFRRITNTDSSRSNEDKKDINFLENDIPHGTMTGMRTFIDDNGKTRYYETMDEEV